ncbi:autotransporter-associated beta strand repeat-containing protein [Parabacteroides sp. FAFU027]|uniref:autotransporter-associated beta strand repeat-containing protein n=1 Tax=Parabacteroides sp. FAFU027 TaxID=2922715 RepID=UPI001FAEBC8D|nr:autotransporter-associated beta strand repeat-containing protein [Parabacteroides sp. FAFU027]
MKKMITFLMASAISVGMAMAQGTFLFNHYSQNFSTVAAGDWGTVDATGAAAYPGGFNVNATNQNLELRGGNTSIAKNAGRTMYKQVVTTPITSPDSIAISFIYKNQGTVTSTGTYLYFCDSNKKPIFGVGGDRTSSQWRPVMPLKFVTLGDSTKNFSIPTANVLVLSTTEGAFKIDVVLHFDTKTYTVNAVKGTYTPGATPDFVPGTAAAVVSSKPFIDGTASDFSWLINTIGSSGGTFSTSYIWGFLDDIAITQVKPYIGDANVNVNAVDADGNVVKTRQVSLPIGQSYTAAAEDFVSFDANGSYYVYDAANTTSLSTICAAGGSSINLHFKKSPSYDGPLTWAAKSKTASWNETDANFVTSTNATTAYQNGRDVIFNGADTTQTVQIATVINMMDKNWTINNGRVVFTGVGSVKTTGNLNLNLASTDSIQIQNANLLSGNVYVKGGYTRLASGGFGSAKVFIQNNAIIALPGASNKLNNEVNIADGMTLSVAGTNLNYQGIGGKVTGAGELKLIAYGPRNEFNADLSEWTGQKITMVAQSGMTSNQLMQVYGTGLTALATRELVIDSLVQVNGTSTSTTSGVIGALSGHKKAVLGALTNTISTVKSATYWKIGGLNNDTEFQGTINESQYQNASTLDSVHVEKVGTGTLTLSGNLTYKGNTRVSAGTLIMKGKMTQSSDTLIIAEGAKAVIAGAKQLDELGVMQYVSGMSQGDAHVSGVLEVDVAAFNCPLQMLIQGTGKLVAKVTNATDAALKVNVLSAEPGATLEIAPKGSYNVGDKFAVFPSEDIVNYATTFVGNFSIDESKWDISELFTDANADGVAGYVVAKTAGTSAVKDIQATSIKAYFTEGMLQISGLQAGDTYKVFNTSGVQVSSSVKLPQGLYMVVVKTAKGNVKLKVANF